MAKKRTHADAARTKMVGARLREASFERVTKAAREAGLSRASYVEHVLENRPLPPAQPVSTGVPVALINELKRIGNNLNQIAHNTHCQIPPQDRVLAGVVAEILQALAEHEVTRRRLASVSGSAADASADQILAELWERITRILPPQSATPASIQPHAQSAAKATETTTAKEAVPHPLDFGPLPTPQPIEPALKPFKPLKPGQPYSFQLNGREWEATETKDTSSALGRAFRSLRDAFRKPAEAAEAAEPEVQTEYRTGPRGSLQFNRTYLNSKPRPPGGDNDS